jgi:hypothetical protein
VRSRLTRIERSCGDNGAVVDLQAPLPLDIPSGVARTAMYMALIH